MTQQLPEGAYKVTTPTGTRTITATILIDEFGYWFTDNDTLLLHIAHGALETIEPELHTTPTAKDKARERLAAMGPQH